MWTWKHETGNRIVERVGCKELWFKLEMCNPTGSFKDRGVTFGTSTRQGVCVQFAEPVPALVPGNLLKHPACTVTVAALRHDAALDEEPQLLLAVARAVGLAIEKTGVLPVGQAKTVGVSF